MLDAVSLRPIHEGKNLFLDLVNDKDSVVSQVLLNIWEKKNEWQYFTASQFERRILLDKGLYKGHSYA